MGRVARGTPGARRDADAELGVLGDADAEVAAAFLAGGGGGGVRSHTRRARAPLRAPGLLLVGARGRRRRAGV